MFKKDIVYNDFNGKQREESFYFHLTKAELLEMEMEQAGGLTAILDRIVKANDTPSLMREFKNLVMRSYGVKSDDGRRFIKNDEVREAFAQTEAYSAIFMELATDDEAAAKFVNGIMPEDVQQKVKVFRDENNRLQVIQKDS